MRKVELRSIPRCSRRQSPIHWTHGCTIASREILVRLAATHGIKAHKVYELGVKVSVAVTNREGLVLGMLALPSNPYDGHTLAPALAQAERISDTAMARAYVDRGHRGHGLEDGRVFAGRRRDMTVTIRRELNGRSAIER
jgi:hypothetical protein